MYKRRITVNDFLKLIENEYAAKSDQLNFFKSISDHMQINPRNISDVFLRDNTSSQRVESLNGHIKMHCENVVIGFRIAVRTAIDWYSAGCERNYPKEQIITNYAIEKIQKVVGIYAKKNCIPTSSIFEFHYNTQTRSSKKYPPPTQVMT